MGGVGKTTLASWVGHRAAQRHRGVWWITATDGATAAEFAREVARSFGATDAELTRAEERGERELCALFWRTLD
jgi:hypothetical protein